jgi:hypothetical protein
MPCSVKIGNDLSLAYDCQMAFGGIEKVEFESLLIGDDKNPLAKFDIEFNNHDGYSNFSETKTADLTGITQCVQTLQLEIPRMVYMEKTEKFSNPNMRFKVTVTNKAKKKIIIGSEYGAQVKSDNAQSGASRGDKSMIQLEIVAEENSLALIEE